MVSFMVWRSTISLRASRTSGSSKGAADALRQKRKELEFSMPPFKTLKPDWPSSVAAFVVEIWWAKSTSPLVSAVYLVSGSVMGTISTVSMAGAPPQ